MRRICRSGFLSPLRNVETGWPGVRECLQRDDLVARRRASEAVQTLTVDTRAAPRLLFASIASAPTEGSWIPHHLGLQVLVNIETRRDRRFVG